MGTALVDLERLASRSPRPFLARRNFQKSILSRNRSLRGSWNFSEVFRGLALCVTRLEPQERAGRIITRAKKERSSNGGPRDNRGPDLKFDSTDMMELEFGRLLGEDRQTTLAKILGKKTNPDLNYVKIEKEKELQEQKESTRRSPPSKVSAPVRPDFKVEEKANDYTSQTFEPGAPDLMPPPVRPAGFEEADASQVRTIRVAPLVRLAGGKKSVDADPYALDGLIRKPVRVSEAENGLPPARPEKAIITPMLMRRKEAVSVDVLPKPGDGLLRRPSSVRLNAFGEPVTTDQIAPSTSIEEVQSANTSEERFTQLLDRELGYQGGQITKSETSVSRKIPPTVRPVLRSLENKPTILERPQKVDSSDKLMNELSNSKGMGAENGPGRQDGEIPNSRPSAELSKPTLVRQQTDRKFKTVNEVPSDENEENIQDYTKTDNIISLGESILRTQVGQSSPVNSSVEDAENDSEEFLNSSPVLRPERRDTLLGSVDAQGSTYKESTPEAVASKLVMRLRKTSLPLQQPQLRKDDGSFLDSTSQDTTSAQDKDLQDQATPAPNSASARLEEEELMAREKAIKEVLQESALFKTRHPVAGLKLSRPASPALTSKKDAQGDITFNNLQKAINSFDERRIIPNKKENDEDWARAEALRDSKAVEELEIIGTGRGGLLVGFGSLVGYLPAFELKAGRRPVSFTAWSQSKAYDAKIKNNTEDEESQNSGGFTKASMESTTASVAQDSRSLVDALEQRSSKAVDPELLDQFKKERAAALSVFVGQKAKVMVISVDKTLRQLRFSEKQAEGEGQELSQRKVTLMESLNLGDVVTCQVKKITTFGAFVDLQGVPALIHNSELSWNRNMDPLSVLQVGQEVKAKVCKLDRYLQRINLSLKVMQPDPLLETLESLVSPDPDLIGASADVESQVEENEELNKFMKKLEQIPEIAAVSRGRRVRGAALAPAFQIYLSGPLHNGYKLLARFGNEVQEVLVETSADRERMKDFIRDCTVQDN